MNANVLIGLGAIVLIAGVGYLAVNSDDQSAPATNATEVSQVGSDDAALTDEMSEAEMMDDETNETMMEEEMAMNDEVEAGEEAEATDASATASESGSYQDYDPAKVAASDAEHIILSFHAPWCPSCRALEQDITADLSAIPAGVEIYKVDYDTATELKQRYGITRQHSLIEIAADGTAEGSVTHPATLAQLVASL